MTEFDHLQNDIERAEFLQNTLVGFATQDGCGGTEEDYIELRKHFLDNPETKNLLPRWVRTNRNSSQFWQFIKHKFGTYAERRTFIWEEMNPLLEYCESKQTFPAGKSISDVLQKFDQEGIHSAWQKALTRKSSDPEGAITISRSILESVCKHILDENGVEYDENKTRTKGDVVDTLNLQHYTVSLLTSTTIRNKYATSTKTRLPRPTASCYFSRH